MVQVSFFAFCGAFVLSLPATHLVRRWALRRGFVDSPGGHKAHAAPVPLGGGIALMVSICGPILAGTSLIYLMRRDTPPLWLPELIRVHMEGIASRLPLVLGLVAAATALHVVGLIDDRKALGPWPKLAVQLAVAVFTAGTMGIRAVEVLPTPLSFVATVVWIVVVTNAFNFLDNMDGLSAGVGAITSAIFAVTALAAGQVFVPVMALVVAGGLGGFLVFNFAPARIFMGDGGSLVIGYLLSVLTILTTYYDPDQQLRPLGVLVPLLVLAVPLYDVGSVVVHRLRLGASPFRADRRHFSHRLVQRGMSPRGAVLTIYLATAATGLPAVTLPRLNWTLAWLLLVQCLCVVTLIAILEYAPAGTQGRPGPEITTGQGAAKAGEPQAATTPHPLDGG